MTHSGQKIMNIIGLRVDLNSGTRTPAVTLGYVRDAWEINNGPMKKHLNNTAMVGYHYTDLRFADGATAFLGSGTAGTTFNDPATLGACAVVKLSGGTRARSEHGRIFHGPLGEGEVNTDGRTIASSTVTSLAAAYELFRTTLLTNGYGLAVISRKNSTSKDVNNVGVNSIVGTQRRRIS